MKTFSQFAIDNNLSLLLWEENVYCSETTQLCYDLWESKQNQIDELTQALIKEQEEVLKYKPIYLKLIAENEILKQKLNCKHTFVGKSENQYCSKCGIE